MSAKALLVGKLNSFPFEDRVLLLDVPVKIGRSHKDDQVQKIVDKQIVKQFVLLDFMWFVHGKIFKLFAQAESGNGYFDCKVLSRQHSLLMYEDEKFYLLDLGKKSLFFIKLILFGYSFFHYLLLLFV